MAARYWVGGTGTWDASSTTNWSASSGGSGGASVPTSADSVIFDQAGTYSVTLSNNGMPCLDFTVSAGTVTFSDTGGITVSGSMSLIASTVWSATGIITFNATTTGKTVTTNGTTFSCVVSFNGYGGGWTLGSALTTVSNLTLLFGTFDTSSSGNYAVSCSSFASSSSLFVRAVNLNASTITCSGSNTTAFNLGSDGNMTFNAGTSQINMSGNSATFAGGGRTFYNVACTSTALTISGNNTFYSISNSVQPATIKFTAGSTQTVTEFNVSGTASNLVTLNSTSPGTRFTLSKSSGTVSRNYLSIQDSAATGGAAWYAGANSTDGGNNTGWTFTAPPSPSGPVAIGTGITVGGGITIG